MMRFYTIVNFRRLDPDAAGNRFPGAGPEWKGCPERAGVRPSGANGPAGISGRYERGCVRLFLLAVLLLAAGGAAAQTSVDDYRRAVVDYSWELKMARADREAAAELRGKAFTGYLPQLSAAGDFAWQFRHTAGVKPWTFALQPRVVQTLYGGGAVRATYREASLAADIAVCREAFALLDVRYAADYAYWNLSADLQYLDAMQRYVAIIRSLQQMVAERFREGYIAKGDLLMIDARLSEAEYELLSVERNCLVARHNFNVLRGTAVSEEVVLAQTILDSIPLPQRVRFEEALARRPDYTAAELSVERAEAAVGTAAAAYNPRIDVGVGGLWQPQSPNLTGRTRIDGSLFVSLSVPIFHFGERRRAVGAARAAYDRSEWSAASLHDAILREEINGWTAVVESRAQVDASEESLRIAGENLDISTYSYNEGLTTILDVLQAQLSWIQLYTNSIKARYNYAVAVSAYGRITARDVDFPDERPAAAVGSGQSD